MQRNAVNRLFISSQLWRAVSRKCLSEMRMYNIKDTWAKEVLPLRSGGPVEDSIWTGPGDRADGGSGRGRGMKKAWELEGQGALSGTVSAGLESQRQCWERGRCHTASGRGQGFILTAEESHRLPLAFSKTTLAVEGNGLAGGHRETSGLLLQGLAKDVVAETRLDDIKRELRMENSWDYVGCERGKVQEWFLGSDKGVRKKMTPRFVACSARWCVCVRCTRACRGQAGGG